jgi:predicted nucleic acid-binding protein
VKILFDTSVILDVFFDRKPYSDASTLLFSHVEAESFEGVISVTSIITLQNLANKMNRPLASQDEIEKLLSLFTIAPVNRRVLPAAVKIGFQSYDHAVLYESGRQAGVQAIVSRDPGELAEADLPVYSPEELVNVIEIIQRSPASTSL